MTVSSPSLQPSQPSQPLTSRQRLLLVLLAFDALVLGVLELFFLPLRLDGIVLPKFGDFPMPVTVVLAVVTTPLLVRTTAKVVRPSFSVIPLLVWVLVVLGVGVTGPGGDLVLIQDWRALLLIGGGALPGALALGGGLGSAAKVAKGVSSG
ncbi:hypothetical protein P3102_31225 [Amycolatopsis sp. QT-25]|uniref:hypothetical protein n=1 Tax=Amycolatopsis sp. QT-25 TaxID=3034022 RepID=UPI0023ED3AF6|nr:hypothetical protein [Amycolatopsis sp. QT-25]WET78485.1 hypothetical protein P3102_31225 [Amycolatopsis sp. QT-25]